MTKHHHEQHPRNPDPGAGEVHTPYWRRAHRDWRFLAVVFLMLAAMGVYVATLNLSIRPHGQGLPLVDNGAK